MMCLFFIKWIKITRPLHSKYMYTAKKKIDVFYVTTSTCVVKYHTHSHKHVCVYLTALGDKLYIWCLISVVRSKKLKVGMKRASRSHRRTFHTWLIYICKYSVHRVLPFCKSSTRVVYYYLCDTCIICAFLPSLSLGHLL